MSEHALAEQEIFTFTVLGAQGFIGRALTTVLREQGHVVHTPAREVNAAELHLHLRGHVIYCIGLTADFRHRPWDTVDAHVGLLRTLLEHGSFASFTYLSSTRVYDGADCGDEEAVLRVRAHAPDHLYNVSKLMGESLCHAAHRPERPVRVVRVSNVVGYTPQHSSFIGTLAQDIYEKGAIFLRSSLDSTKDYIALTDVTRMLPLIATQGQAPCYNLASGQALSHREVLEALLSLLSIHVQVQVAADAPCHRFPPIQIHRLKQAFGFQPSPPLRGLAHWFPMSHPHTTLKAHT